MEQEARESRGDQSHHGILNALQAAARVGYWMWNCETGELVLDSKHVLLTDATRLPFLADVLPLPGAVLSLGDVFLAIGVAVFLEDQMRQPLTLFAHRVTGIPGSAAE